MTEEQAIERIKARLYWHIPDEAPPCAGDLARIAWDEMKAIAREDAKHMHRYPGIKPRQSVLERYCTEPPQAGDRTTPIANEHHDAHHNG